VEPLKVDHPKYTTVTTVIYHILIQSIYLSKQLKAGGVLCRDANNECDLPEYCSGDNGQCPLDVYKKNGNPCGLNQTSQQNTGKFFFCEPVVSLSLSLLYVTKQHHSITHYATKSCKSPFNKLVPIVKIKPFHNENYENFPKTT
jgi:hypothetical protein